MEFLGVISLLLQSRVFRQLSYLASNDGDIHLQYEEAYSTIKHIRILEKTWSKLEFRKKKLCVLTKRLLIEVYL